MTNPLRKFSRPHGTVIPLLAILAAGLPSVRGAEPEPLKLIQTLPMPGVSGRMDHFACDVAAQRLVVAALGNDTAEVFDLTKGARVASIPALSKPQGVLVLSELGRMFIANGSDGSLRAFAAESFKPMMQIDGLDDADNVRFDASDRLVYVGFGDGALGVIDPTTVRLLQRISLAAHPESFQLEKIGRKIFVNVPDARQIAVVDRDKKAVVATWPTEQWQANFPMALDEANHRLFVGCRSPARLLIIDTANGKRVADLEISGDTDDVFYDAKRQRIYASCGAGFIDVVQCRTGDRYERIAHLSTRDGARTAFFSPELDRLYLAVPRRIGHEAEIRVYQPQ